MCLAEHGWHRAEGSGGDGRPPAAGTSGGRPTTQRRAAGAKDGEMHFRTAKCIRQRWSLPKEAPSLESLETRLERTLDNVQEGITLHQQGESDE